MPFAFYCLALGLSAVFTPAPPSLVLADAAAAAVFTHTSDPRACAASSGDVAIFAGFLGAVIPGVIEFWDLFTASVPRTLIAPHSLLFLSLKQRPSEILFPTPCPLVLCFLLPRA